MVCVIVRRVGIGCALLGWVLLGGIGVVISVSGVFVLVSGLRDQSTPRTILGGAITTIGSIATVAAVALIISWVTLGGRPRYSTDPAVFRAEFGFSPGPDVTSIESQSSASTDSNVRFLRFRASPDTIAAIVRRRFKQVGSERCEQQFRRHDESRPAWWSPQASPSLTCYVAEPYDEAFATNRAWLAYDAGSRQAHYYNIGID